nr:rhodanese-like domain-containing protein [Limisalsivibrio acetivorans]
MTEVNVDDVQSMMDKGEDFVLLDIREAVEQGFVIAGGVVKRIPRGLLEWVAGKQIGLDEKVVVYCKTGLRGAFATKRLQELGYKNVVNLKGGIVAWMEAGKPIATYIGNVVPKDYSFK